MFWRHVLLNLTCEWNSIVDTIVRNRVFKLQAHGYSTLGESFIFMFIFSYSISSHLVDRIVVLSNIM